MVKKTQAVLNEVANNVAVIATDKAGIVTAFNKGAEDLSGYSMDEIIKKPAPIEEFEHLSKRIKATSYESLNGQLRHKKGHGVAVKIIASAITDNKNNTNGFLFMATTNNLASHDFDITQLYNEEIFNTTFENEFKRMQRYQQPIALLKIDVDGYTTYKKTHGEAQAKECLNQIAYVLYSRVKRAGDFLAYMGHDEFMVILPNTDKPGAIKMAEYLRLLVHAKQLGELNNGPNNRITISLGVAHLFPSKDDQSTKLLDLADKGLRQAKSEGRNCSRLGDAC